jgi:hypothetical protein
LILKVIAMAALSIAIAVAAIVFTMPKEGEAGAANVKFSEFTPDGMDTKVGESTNIVFNVQNLEERSIKDSKVLAVIEPPGYQPLPVNKRPHDRDGSAAGQGRADGPDANCDYCNKRVG